jgi:RHS repeat-associated protein
VGNLFPARQQTPNATMQTISSTTGLDVCASRYTGKERDTESGVDYFGARYYASAMGRFMSPDWASKPEPVPYSSLGDPQTLNLYSYVRNNPLWKPDIDGHGYWSDAWKQFKTDVTAAVKSASLTIEGGAGLKVKAGSKETNAHIGGTVHAEIKYSSKGSSVTGKAEVDAGVQVDGKGVSRETGFQKTQNEDDSVTPTQRYTETETSVTVGGHEVSDNKDEISLGGADYEGAGAGAKVSVSENAVKKVGSDIVDAIKQILPTPPQP